jgi:hypothetical protein
MPQYLYIDKKYSVHSRTVCLQSERDLGQGCKMGRSEMTKPSEVLREMADILDKIELEEKMNGVTPLSIRLKLNYAQLADLFTELIRKY